MNEKLYILWISWILGVTLHDLNMIAGTLAFTMTATLSALTIYKNHIKRDRKNEKRNF